MQVETNQLMLLGGAVALSVVFLFFWKKLFLKNQAEHDCHADCHHVHAEGASIDSAELSAISGEDVQVTQLNLAKAYLEINNTDLAKSLLNSVLVHGNLVQRKEAEKILQQL